MCSTVLRRFGSVGYRIADAVSDILPVGAEVLEQLRARLRGHRRLGTRARWGARVRRAAGERAALPESIEEVCGVPIDVISTGPDRDETIVLRHPFD
jgi:adenylosuccinate synthase